MASITLLHDDPCGLQHTLWQITVHSVIQMHEIWVSTSVTDVYGFQRNAPTFTTFYCVSTNKN